MFVSHKEFTPGPTLPKIQGVYFLSFGKKLFYIGKTRNLRFRMYTHHHQGKWDLLKITKCLYPMTDLDRHYFHTILETALIQHHKPVTNRHPGVVYYEHALHQRLIGGLPNPERMLLLPLATVELYRNIRSRNLRVKENQLYNHLKHLPEASRLLVERDNPSDTAFLDYVPELYTLMKLKKLVRLKQLPQYRIINK